MPPLLRSLVTNFLFLLPLAAWAETSSWAYLDLPADREQPAVSLLEARGITTLAWSNAVVEISAFAGLEMVPLAKLDQKLTVRDPRWDPWLVSLKPSFRPRDSTSRIWILNGQRGQAQRLLGREAQGGGRGAQPRQVTGVLVAAFTVFYLILRLWSGRRPRLRSPRRSRRWLGGVGVLLAGALVLMMAGEDSPPVSTAPKVSWMRHLWYQQAWPYGATWSDWEPGKAWSYRSYERRDGRLFEVESLLPKPDKAWSLAAQAGWDPHHAARIFGQENP